MAADLSDRVAASAEGNPLFVEELVRMLIDERHLGQDASALPMPATIHAVLAARLDRLDSAELAIVKAAAVIGKSFSDEAALLLAGRRDPPSWSLISARWCASRSSRRTADASAAEGRSASSTSSCATWPTRASSRRSAPIFMSATRTGSRARGGRARGRVPGDPRAPPRAFHGNLVRAGADRRAGTRAGRARLRHLGASGSARPGTRRHSPGGQPARASRVAPARG